MPVIGDLQLTITPLWALCVRADVGPTTVNVDTTQGRYAIIIDFSQAESLYTRDLSTAFSWPIDAGTILDIWQPSVVPLDEDVYQRLSFHFLMKSLGGVGWQHLRELNLAYSSTAEIQLQLTFDTGAFPTGLTLTIPNSNGKESKLKIIPSPNKWKLIEGMLVSAEPFLLWSNDMEMKIKSWGVDGPYRIVKPFSG